MCTLSAHRRLARVRRRPRPDYKVKWGPDPNNPGKCIGHGGDPLKDGRFSNCAGDQHPLDSPSYLWAVLNKCDAAMAPPPSPPDLLCGFPQ